MESPVELQITLASPAVPSGREPKDPVFARVRVAARPEAAVRPQLDLCFVLDASASMHRFVLEPQQRAQWQQRAEQRGEITRQQAEGRAAMVWVGQTLRELQQHVSTPMLSALRGIWRTLEALQPQDTVSVLGFADTTGVVYQDAGVSDGAARLDAAKSALARLGSGVDESGLGRGTRLSAALQHAVERLSADGAVPALRRMVMVSDGVIEDRDTCRPLLDAAVDRGVVISVIGVGDEFDEEFLMTVADLSRGNYYYAATAREVEQALRAELEIVTSIVGRQALLRLQPDNGTVIRDVYPFAPALSEFQTLWVENGGWRFRIGDLSPAQEMEFLVELAPAAHEGGEARLATIRIEGVLGGSAERFHVDAPIALLYTDEPALIQARADDVLDAVRRLEVYREERRAAEAGARGDQEGATRHLRAATRMLRKIGQEDLAQDMDAAAEDLESGTRNLSRTKRVKAGTRRLGAR
jgi:Ca-activated chloride channel family protein